MTGLATTSSRMILRWCWRGRGRAVLSSQLEQRCPISFGRRLLRKTIFLFFPAAAGRVVLVQAANGFEQRRSERVRLFRNGDHYFHKKRAWPASAFFRLAG